MQDKYYELTIGLDDTFVELIADYISNIYSEGLELGDGEIIVRSESDLTFVKEALVSLAQNLETPIDMSYNMEQKENINWIKSYQDSIEPIEAGKFYISPSWYEEREGFINIKIDPALAFGSGHHATTFSCLEAISEFVDETKFIVDVGCGSGILGLACTKIGATVDLCDTDPLSVKSCRENFELNGEKYNSLWEGSIDNRDKNKGEYDVVVANIIADVLKFLAKDLKRACVNDGILILSGILDKKEDLVIASFGELKLLKRTLKDAWVTLVYQKEII